MSRVNTLSFHKRITAFSVFIYKTVVFTLTAADSVHSLSLSYEGDFYTFDIIDLSERETYGSTSCFWFYGLSRYHRFVHEIDQLKEM